MFAFQNCGKQIGNLELTRAGSTLLSVAAKNVFMIPQDSDAKEFKLESIYPDDKSQVVQYILKSNELPMKTKHGFITKFEPRFGLFSYEPDNGFFGEDIIEFTEENLISNGAAAARVEISGEAVVNVFNYVQKMHIIVNPPMTLTLAPSGVLTETPSIILTNPRLNEVENSELTFEVLVLNLLDDQEEGKALTNWIKIKNKEKINA